MSFGGRHCRLQLGLRPRVIGLGQTSTQYPDQLVQGDPMGNLVQNACVYHIIQNCKISPQCTSVKRVSDQEGKSSVHVAKSLKEIVKWANMYVFICTKIEKHCICG